MTKNIDSQMGRSNESLTQAPVPENRPDCSPGPANEKLQSQNDQDDQED